MNKRIFVLFIVAILGIILYLYSFQRIEYFYNCSNSTVYGDPIYESVYKKMVADTRNSALTYNWCIGLSEKEYISDKRIQNAPFYTVSFMNKKISKFSEIEDLLVKELTILNRKGDIGPVAVIITTLPDKTYEFYFLFPNFTKSKEQVPTLENLVKNYRWYYILLYSNIYSASNLCIDKKYAQCAGIPITDKQIGIDNTPYAERSGCAPGSSPCKSTSTETCTTDSNTFDTKTTTYLAKVYRKYYNRYITPCGISEPKKFSENNTFMPKYKKTHFFTFYRPNIGHAKFSAFKTIEDVPNVSMLSDGDSMRYGCDTQLISENKKYVLMLEKSGNSKGLRLYKIIPRTVTNSYGNTTVEEEDPFTVCRRGGELTYKERIWSIPLSKDIASFKVIDNKIVLVDYDIVIWSISANIPNTPILLKLENDGSLRVYDSNGSIIQEYSTDEISKIENPAYISTKFKLNMAVLRKNFELQKIADKEIPSKLSQDEDLDELLRKKEFEMEESCSR